MSVLALALISFAPSAPNPSPLTPQVDSGPSYSYLQLAIGSGNVDVFGDSYDADDIIVGGSIELTESIFGLLSIGNSDIDTGIAGVSLETDAVQVGFGFHTAMSAGTDLYGTLSYIDAEVTLSAPGFGSVSESDDGHAIGFGVRGALSEQIEFNLGLSLIEIGDADSVQQFSIGAIYNMTEQIGLGFNLVNSDDADSVLVGLRVYL